MELFVPINIIYRVESELKMGSIRQEVEDFYMLDKSIGIADLRNKFPHRNEGSLSTALTKARIKFPFKASDKLKITKIDEKAMEQIVIELLNQRQDSTNIKIAVDFLKIKRMSTGLDEDIDIEKFLKMGIEAKGTGQDQEEVKKGE